MIFPLEAKVTNRFNYTVKYQRVKNSFFFLICVNFTIFAAETTSRTEFGMI